MPKSGAFARLAITIAIAATIPLLFASLPAYSESVKRLQNEDEEVRRVMVQISRQLGVECTTCHNVKNFALANKPEYKVAKEHIRITQLLIDHGMDGKDHHPKADCYMCHRGVLHPKPEPFDPMTMEKQKVKVPDGEVED